VSDSLGVEWVPQRTKIAGDRNTTTLFVGAVSVARVAWRDGESDVEWFIIGHAARGDSPTIAEAQRAAELSVWSLHDTVARAIADAALSRAVAS
jgi:hypothetical protein